MTRPNIVVIGDGIVDEIRLFNGQSHRHPGGAALNLAAGNSILGASSTLLFNCGDDAAGEWIRDHLRRIDVNFVCLPSTAPTGVASSYLKSIDAEPSYEFNEAVRQRRYRFTPQSACIISAADAVAITAFPFDEARSVEGVLSQLEQFKGWLVVDPNPRADLLDNIADFRDGFEKVAAQAKIVKFSDEDLSLLYPGDESVIDRLNAQGTNVVVTHGAAGASAYLPEGIKIHTPVVTLSDPIIDTLGAGDATLATLMTHLVGNQTLTDPSLWTNALEHAMEVAAHTCRAPGGTLRQPPPPAARSKQRGIA